MLSEDKPVTSDPDAGEGLYVCMFVSPEGQKHR